MAISGFNPVDNILLVNAKIQVCNHCPFFGTYTEVEMHGHLDCLKFKHKIGCQDERWKQRLPDDLHGHECQWNKQPCKYTNVRKRYVANSCTDRLIDNIDQD